MGLRAKIGIGGAILGAIASPGIAAAYNYGSAVRAGQAEDNNRWLARTIQTHRVGALGQGDRSYLTPAATSASGMTLALHYASRQGVLKRSAQGAYVRNALPSLDGFGGLAGYAGSAMSGTANAFDAMGLT